MFRWLWVMVALGVTASCSSTSKVKLSALGEACMEHSDCGSGLACANGACSKPTFGLKESSKQCVAVECREDDDCCSDICRTYRAACVRGDTAACASAEAACDCGATCQDGACNETCSDTEPCSDGRFCATSRCVQCACDAHCGTGNTCQDGSCRPACTDDAGCGYITSPAGQRVLTRCSEGACVETNCSTNRECVALLQDTRAVCDGGDCRMPCQTDMECGSPESFEFMACVAGMCRSLGCETTAECRALLSRHGEEGVDVECKEWTPPGPLAPGVGGELCPGANPLTCGDGVLDVGEECDGSNFGGETCSSFTQGTLPSGPLTCRSCAISTSRCGSGSSICGDGFIDPGEDCDGVDLGGETCATATFGARPEGSLSCFFSCSFDTTFCTSSPGGFCGDGFVDVGEDCDGANLGGETCLTWTLGARPDGSLSCLGCSLDSSSCTSSPGGFCGDGFVDVGEDCDGTNLGGETCSTATFGARPYGTPSCLTCSLDTASCTATPAGFCGDGIIGVGEDCDGVNLGGETCSSWTFDAFPAGTLSCSGCFMDTSGCTTSGSCTDSCRWANDQVCDEPSICPTGTDCTDCNL